MQDRVISVSANINLPDAHKECIIINLIYNYYIKINIKFTNFSSLDTLSFRF